MTRGVRIRLMAFVVLSAVGITYITAAYLGVVDRVTGRQISVTASLPGSGGLFEGSEVTYRGVKIGRVARMDATAEGVDLSLELEPGTELPVEATLHVHNLSAVGEQYLDFQPTTASGPYLHDGSRVRADAVDLPTTLASTVVSLEKLMDQVDPEQLHAVIAGLRTTFAGREDELGDLVEGSQVLLVTLDEEWPTISRVLVTARTSAEHVVEMLGLASMSAANNIQRQAFLSAQFDLRSVSFGGERSEALGEGLGGGARRRVESGVPRVQGIREPRPRDVGQQRVDTDLGFERGLREAHDPPRPVPRRRLVGVEQ